MVNMTHTGDHNTATCAHAGVTTIDQSSTDITKCVRPRFEKYNSSYDKHQPMYSKSNVLLIILYSYREYCAFKINFLLSTSLCQPVQINTCETEHHGMTVNSVDLSQDLNTGHLLISVPENHCVILQFLYVITDTTKSNQTACHKVIRPASVHSPGKMIEYFASGFLRGKSYVLFVSERDRHPENYLSHVCW